jgi:hypothetical protein
MLLAITSKFLALAGVPIAKKNEDRYQAPNLKPGSDHDSISSNDDDLSHLSDETKPQKKKKPFIDVDTVIRDFEDLLVANEDEEDEDSDMRAFIIPYPVPTTLKDANILYASITHFLVLVCHLPSGTEGENIVVNVDDKACSIAINVPVPTKLLDGKRLLGNRLEMANPGLGQLIEEELTREWEDAANGGIAAQGQVAFQKIVKWDSQFRVQGSWLYLDSHLPIPARSHDGSTPSVLSIRKVSTDQPQFAPNIDIDMSSFTGPAVLAIGMLPARDSEASTFVKPVHGLKSVAVFDDNDSPTSAHGGSGPTRSSPKRRRGTNRGRNRVEDDEEEEIEAPRPARGWLYRRT